RWGRWSVTWSTSASSSWCRIRPTGAPSSCGTPKPAARRRTWVSSTSDGSSSGSPTSWATTTRRPAGCSNGWSRSWSPTRRVPPNRLRPLPGLPNLGRVRRLLPLLLLLTALGAVPGPAVALPPGEPSVTIATYSGATDATTSIQVQLLLVWPSGADHVSVTNGDGTSQTSSVVDSLGWQLVSPTPGTAAETRTVTVTYTGP